MHSGGKPVGDPSDDLSRAVLFHNCQTLTPETETSTHYFFQESHRTGDGEGSLNETIHASLLEERVSAEAADAPSARHRLVQPRRRRRPADLHR